MNNIAWESLGFSMSTCLLFLLGGTSSGFDGWGRVGGLGNYFQVVRGFHSFYAFVGQISKIQHYFCVNDPRSYECYLSSSESICILLAMFPEGKPINRLVSNCSRQTEARRQGSKEKFIFPL